MNNDVRVNFEVDRDLHAKIARTFPYGMRGPVLRALVTAIADAVEEHGQMILGAVMSGDYKIVYERRRKDAP